MKVSVWQKDMAVIGEFAHKLGCPTPLFDATIPVYDEGDEDRPRRARHRGGLRGAGGDGGREAGAKKEATAARKTTLGTGGSPFFAVIAWLDTASRIYPTCRA